jgi:hypothetical protein
MNPYFIDAIQKETDILWYTDMFCIAKVINFVPAIAKDAKQFLRSEAFADSLLTINCKKS